MPSLWCLLLMSPVFFLSHQWTSVVFHQTDCATTDVCRTIDPSSMDQLLLPRSRHRYLTTELSHAPSIYVYSGHDNWFYFYLRIGSLTLIIGWLKLWGTVGFPIPHGDSSMYPSLVIQSTFHVQPSTFE